MFELRAAEAAPETLAGVESDWQVQDGAIAITVQQLGSDIRGEFSDWTAAIAFDEVTETGEATITINVPSLALGSVTDQAMGPDYFAAGTHPAATFAADIAPAGDPADPAVTHIATGTLTLKGVQVPVALPFVLAIDDGTATVEGRVALQRLDFGIGGDAGDPGRTVDVAISLTATKGESPAD